MHPELLHQLNRSRVVELQRLGARARRAEPRRLRRGRGLQGAAGWFLVEVGLRLAARDLVASQPSIGARG